MLSMTNYRIRFFPSLRVGSGILSSLRGCKQVRLSLYLQNEGHRSAIFIIIDRFGSEGDFRGQQLICRIF
jgi:hypothetical protein